MRCNSPQAVGKIKRVKGFVVNVYDATNFDIDLDLSTLPAKYGNAITNTYWYKSITPNETGFEISAPISATSYRCRLKGVSAVNQLGVTSTWPYNKIVTKVSNYIDRADGWVECILAEVDIYKRILVTILVHLPSGETINIRDLLLSHDKIFCPYSKKSHRKSQL